MQTAINMKNSVADEATIILAAIKAAPVSDEAKEAAINLLAAGEAWLGDEDAGTVAEALCKKAYAMTE